MDAQTRAMLEQAMKKMTVIFEDEDLYRAVKIEAARTGRQLKDLVTEALREWLEAREDAEWLPSIRAARKEWERQGGVEAGEFLRDLQGAGAATKSRRRAAQG